MNVDRSGDYSGSRWRGRVVNVMDPYKQGRLQVRVFGLHDNETLIPNAELPWALTRTPINSGAAVRGVSGSPVGVIPGTIVDGYFADSDRRVLVATGTLSSAGRTRPGEIVDSSYAIDPAYNDVANSARGQDLNAALGLRNFPALSQIGAIFPAVSGGIGPMASHGGNILSLLTQADPYNMSGSMADSVSGFYESYALNQIMSAASSFSGGIGGLAFSLVRAQDMLQQGKAEAEALAALPTQIQVLAANGGIAQLLLLANTMTNIDPTSMLGSTVGGLMSQAFGLSSIIGGGFSSILSEAVSALAATSKLRDFAMKAAEPTPPPIPDPPATTSSTAVTTPSSSGKTNPYESPQTVTLPPPVMSADMLDTNQAPQTITVEQEKFIEANVPVNTAEENLAIMDQIDNREAQNQAQLRAIEQVLQQY